MSQSVRVPKTYRPSLIARLRDGLRYGGGVGQWSWLLHRLTGVGILVFLILHVIDTFFVVAYPALYDHTVAIYGGMLTGLHPSVNGYYWSLRWAFRLGELGLIACVLFHALNGVRIVMFDFWPGASRRQEAMFRVVLIVFVLMMIPISFWVFRPLTQTPNHWKMAPAEEQARQEQMVAAPGTRPS